MAVTVGGINEIDWGRIEGFIGYGRLDAPVVFLGMEEGAAADPVADLRKRSAYETVRDMNAGSDYQATWARMADLMLRRAGVMPTKTARAAYQADRLGRPNGETLIAELLPYPNKRADHWHPVFHERFSSRRAYEAVMIPRRVKLLREVLSGAPRELVVAYGAAHWRWYKEIFPDVVWAETKPFLVGACSAARVILAPHFVTRANNGRGDMLAELSLR